MKIILTIASWANKPAIKSIGIGSYDRHDDHCLLPMHLVQSKKHMLVVKADFLDKAIDAPMRPAVVHRPKKLVSIYSMFKYPKDSCAKSV